MIELIGVEFAWPDEPPLFGGLSLRVEAGERVVLLGANGCGKSTLLKLMNALIEPSAGELRWQGERLDRARLREAGRGRAFRRACGLLFQHPEAMLFNPTVRDELAFAPSRLGLTDVEARVARWAAELGLEAVLDRPPFMLSGGQKQKVALASLMTVEPELLLLDEPSASLDPASVGWLIEHLARSGRTLVTATHNLSLAAELGERGIVLDRRGALLFDGPIAAALADLERLERAGLAHRHRHRHAGVEHSHLHAHDWA